MRDRSRERGRCDINVHIDGDDPQRVEVVKAADHHRIASGVLDRACQGVCRRRHQIRRALPGCRRVGKGQSVGRRAARIHSGAAIGQRNTRRACHGHCLAETKGQRDRLTNSQIAVVRAVAARDHGRGKHINLPARRVAEDRIGARAE